MKNKTFIAIVITTLVLIVLTISLVTEKQQARLEKDNSGKPYLPLLQKDINAVSMFEMTQRGETITIAHDGDMWQVNERSGYPADFVKLRQALIALSDLKTIEAKTKKPEHYERLGVQDPDVNNNSKLVTIKDADGNVLASLIIGNSKHGGAGKPELYVRKSDDEQTWLVEGRIILPNRPVDWLDTSIVDINQASIKQVTIIQPDKKRLTILKEKQDDKEFKVKELGKDKTPKPGMVNNIASALGGLKLEDVVSNEGFGFDDKNTVTARYETFDGLIVTASLIEKDNKYYAHFEATFAENATATQQPAEDNTQESFNVVGAASQQAAMLNQKLHSWVYIIPGFKADLLKTRLEDLVEKQK